MLAGSGSLNRSKRTCRMFVGESMCARLVRRSRKRGTPEEGEWPGEKREGSFWNLVPCTLDREAETFLRKCFMETLRTLPICWCVFTQIPQIVLRSPHQPLSPSADDSE